MKKTKILLGALSLTALTPVMPMALTSCSSSSTGNFKTESWTNLIANCSSAVKFYNTYVKGSADEALKDDQEGEAIARIKLAIKESVQDITDPTTQEYKFNKKIKVGTAEATIRLIDVGHDVAKTANKTTFTFEFADSVDMGMFDENENGKEWTDADSPTMANSCLLRRYLDKNNETSGFVTQLPTEVKNAIVAVTKKTYIKNSSTPHEFEETIFVPEGQEIGIKKGERGEYETTDETYEFYKYIKLPEGTGVTKLNNPLYNKYYYGDTRLNWSYWTRIKNQVGSMATYSTYCFYNGKIRVNSRDNLATIAPIFNI